jgi:beta-aspartyl-dipeptidase (metallo-type)
MSLENALPAFTSNPAKLLRLTGKGVITRGADADLVALDEQCAAHTVLVRGEIVVEDGRAVRRGTFE